MHKKNNSKKCLNHKNLKKKKKSVTSKCSCGIKIFQVQMMKKLNKTTKYVEHIKKTHNLNIPNCCFGH